MAESQRQAALRAEAALATFRAEASLWRDEERVIESALAIIRRHTPELNRHGRC